VGILDPTVTIAGQFVSLRPVSREDYPTLFRWRSSLETVHMLNVRRHIATYEQFVAELEQMLHQSILLLVRKAGNGAPIGYALTYQMNQWDGGTGVGLYVEPPYRLRGPGGEAALLCIDALFRWFPLRKVHTEIYEFAAPLVRMLEAMGFEQQGYLPEHYWHDDRFWGLYNMVLTRDQWQRRREHFAAILEVQQRYEELTHAPGGGHKPETAPAKGGGR
jgi:RimJ/RimL family protein N-acetyltransferase